MNCKIKKYYCKESKCRNTISYSNFKYGKRRCAVCAQQNRHKDPKKSGGYIDGRYIIKHYCIKCNNEISYPTWKYGLKMCSSCSHKGKKYNRTKSSSYIDGRCLKQYYCKICGNKICLQIALYGKGKCNRCKPIGKDHPNYIDNLDRDYPLNFRNSLKELIRNRDNRKCQLCGCPEIECDRKLLVHYINYNKYNLFKNNLISLCNSCHMKINFNRDYWYAYFRKILEEVYNEKE